MKRIICLLLIISFTFFPIPSFSEDKKEHNLKQLVEQLESRDYNERLKARKQLDEECNLANMQDYIDAFKYSTILESRMWLCDKLYRLGWVPPRTIRKIEKELVNLQSNDQTKQELALERILYEPNGELGIEKYFEEVEKNSDLVFEVNTESFPKFMFLNQEINIKVTLTNKGQKPFWISRKAIDNLDLDVSVQTAQGYKMFNSILSFSPFIRYKTFIYHFYYLKPGQSLTTERLFKNYYGLLGKMVVAFNYENHTTSFNINQWDDGLIKIPAWEGYLTKTFVTESIPNPDDKTGAVTVAKIELEHLVKDIAKIRMSYQINLEYLKNGAAIIPPNNEEENRMYAILWKNNQPFKKIPIKLEESHAEFSDSALTHEYLFEVPLSLDLNLENCQIQLVIQDYLDHGLVLGKTSLTSNLCNLK